MANSTKKLPAHNVKGAQVRVYLDIESEENEYLETLAAANGRTKKGQLEWMIREARAEHIVREDETNQRAVQQKKGKK